ncbi:MAG: B12-binding domain-containing radical SAM protein, partial [Candidatus Thorarchaeota archaeon]
MTDPIIIVDALSAGIGKRLSSRDSIGCGPRAIAGIFESQKLSCRIVRSESIIKSPRMIRRFSHVAISGMTMDLPIVKQIVSIWRKHHRSGRIILGGPIASDTIPILKSVKPDVLVWGEGEETLTELIKKNYLDEDIDLSVVQGIGFFEGAIPKVTPVRAPLLSRTLWKRFFPSTTRIVDYPAYQASKVYVEVIRGCSNYGRTTLPLPDGRECTDCSNCTSEDSFQRTICPEEINPGCGFCSVPTVWGPPRSRETDSIVQEVEELLELGVRRVVLEAPDFLDYFRGSEPLTSPCIPVANIDAIVALVERIQNLIQIASKEAYLSIENMKACLFTEEVAKRLSDVIGASSPNIGLETGSEIHSKQIGKCGTPEDVV